MSIVNKIKVNNNEVSELQEIKAMPESKDIGLEEKMEAARKVFRNMKNPEIFRQHRANK